MKKIAFLILFSISISIVHAKTGSEGVGGGDPHAIEFIELGDKIGHYLSSSNMFPEIESEDFKAVIKNIRNSLDNGKNQPQIRFQNSEVICINVTKIGCVLDDKSIIVNRNEWKQLSTKDKIELVSLEILQVLNFKERYSLAQSIGSYSKDILKKSSIVPQMSCMSIAIERALTEARKANPNYLFIVPQATKFVANEELKHKYEVSIGVATSDDYHEDLIFEYRFNQKNCIK